MKIRLRKKRRTASPPGRVTFALLFCYAASLSASDLQVFSEPTEMKPAQIYRSPEERREAGLGRRLTKWLTVSGLAELETQRERHDFHDNEPDARGDEDTQTVQLGFDARFSDRVNAELVFEYELDTDHGALDEGLINLETETWKLSAGRLYVPFGEYFSHFVTGPMLEFGETRADALNIDYSFGDSVELFVFGFNGDANHAGADDAFDWGGGIEISTEDDAIKVGASYLSDLAETSASFLKDHNNSYRNQVAGWSVWILAGMNTFEITAEVIMAMDSFNELEKDVDKPRAYNIEIAWLPRPVLQLAVRLEGSDELEDEPKHQYGLSATWRIGKHISLAADYLHGEFKQGFVVDDDDNALDTRSLFAAQLSLEF